MENYWRHLAVATSNSFSIFVFATFVGKRREMPSNYRVSLVTDKSFVLPRDFIRFITSFLILVFFLLITMTKRKRNLLKETVQQYLYSFFCWIDNNLFQLQQKLTYAQRCRSFPHITKSNVEIKNRRKNLKVMRNFSGSLNFSNALFAM